MAWAIPREGFGARGLIASRGQSISRDNAGLAPGDVLVGLDYEPAPRASTAPTLARLVGDWAGDGKLLLNYWRSADPRLAIALATAARSSPRAVLVTAPAEAAKEASRSRSGIWGTATLAVCVTGDGGRGDLTVSEAALGGAQQPATVAVAIPAAPARGKRKDRRASLGTEIRLSAAEKNGGRGLALQPAANELRTSATDPIRHAPMASATLGDAPARDERNYAVFKRLLQTGATLDEIVAEMRIAGVPPQTTDRIVDSLRSIVANRGRQAPEEPRSGGGGSSASSSGDAGRGAPATTPTHANDPRAAVMAMIAKRSVCGSSGSGDEHAAVGGAAKGGVADGSASGSSDGGTSYDGVLARYRKMCKLGVPPASVRQRMGLDQVNAEAILIFSKEFGLEVLDDVAPAAPGGKRARLHWDAMTLDDGAMSASVWAADAFGGLDDDSDDDIEASDDLGRAGGFVTFGEDDMGRLATLFEEASGGSGRGGMHARCVEDDANVLRLCGEPESTPRTGTVRALRDWGLTSSTVSATLQPECSPCGVYPSIPSL